MTGRSFNDGLTTAIKASREGRYDLDAETAYEEERVRVFATADDGRMAWRRDALLGRFAMLAGADTTVFPARYGPGWRVAFEVQDDRTSDSRAFEVDLSAEDWDNADSLRAALEEMRA